MRLQLVPCVDGPFGSRASTRKLTSGSTAVMCPAYVTRCDDRWPRWVPRSSPKQHVDLEGRRYYRVLWILGLSDCHLDELSHPAATRRSEGGSARRIVTQAATWVIRSPGHSRSRGQFTIVGNAVGSRSRTSCGSNVVTLVMGLWTLTWRAMHFSWSSSMFLATPWRRRRWRRADTFDRSS